MCLSCSKAQFKAAIRIYLMIANCTFSELWIYISLPSPLSACHSSMKHQGLCVKADLRPATSSSFFFLCFPLKSSSAPEITRGVLRLLHPLPWIVLTALMEGKRYRKKKKKKSSFLILTRKSVTRKQHDRRQSGSSALPAA